MAIRLSYLTLASHTGCVPRKAVPQMGPRFGAPMYYLHDVSLRRQFKRQCVRGLSRRRLVATAPTPMVPCGANTKCYKQNGPPSYTSLKSKSTTCTAVPFTKNTLSTPSSASRYRSNSGSHAQAAGASHTASQSRKWPAAVLRRMLSAVEFGAFDGRSSSSACAAERGGATALPRFPMTVGVPVTLFALWSAGARGRGVRVQCAVVLRQ